MDYGKISLGFQILKAERFIFVFIVKRIPFEHVQLSFVKQTHWWVILLVATRLDGLNYVFKTSLLFFFKVVNDLGFLHSTKYLEVLVRNQLNLQISSISEFSSLFLLIIKNMLLVFLNSSDFHFYSVFLQESFFWGLFHMYSNNKGRLLSIIHESIDLKMITVIITQ